MLPFTRLELADAIQRGEVTARRHPSLPYTIYNYSADVQWTNTWNDVTLNCRGLILDDNHNVIARPWKKFFNLGQVDLPIQFDTPVEVMDKADGSLGILYPAGDGYAIATRGSFISDQAVHATKVWNERYSHLAPIDGYTLLFEIVYPENRIVLNYDGMDDLILLGSVENATGFYHGPKTARYHFLQSMPFGWDYGVWSGPVVEVFDYKNISEALGHMDRPNAEGYVIRSHNFMVKVKQPDYLELHKLVTNASPKTVWEQLKAGKSKDEIVANFPDEFHDYISSMIDPLIETFEARSQEIFDGWCKVMDDVQDDYRPISVTGGPPRKEYARAFSKHPDKKYYFLLLDSRSIRDVLWQELRPREVMHG